MVVVERKPALDVHSESHAVLRVDRKEILFHDLPGDKVRVQIRVHNDGIFRSEPTLMRIESAPLGAFVPWKPLTQLRVPSIEPGESRVPVTEVIRSRPVPLGNFDRVPPRTLLTAVSSPDETPPANPDMRKFWALMFRSRSRRPSNAGVNPGTLAPDLMDLLGNGQPYWAGNINVFVGNRAVERHIARALRVYPGRTNLAMFVVGSPPNSDAFEFELIGLDSEWKAQLFDMTNGKSLRASEGDGLIESDRWVESNGMLLVMLAIQPPSNCDVGNLEVHVTRRSSRETAIVEFNLDPKSQGTGCYCA